MNSTDWKIRLLKELGLKDDNDEIALENYASILKNIFQDSLYPQVSHTMLKISLLVLSLSIYSG